MIDAVLSYHMNPATCGVAKWNIELAKRLGVPIEPISELRPTSRPRYTYPLLSIKASEIPSVYWSFVPFPVLPVFDAVLHDWIPQCWGVSRLARRVFAVNTGIAEKVRSEAGRQDVIEIGCPSTLNGNPTRGAYRVLVFGMAHKLVLPHFENLKRELDTEHPDYTVELSTAVHEGSPWDGALEESAASMRAIFGDKLRVLGFLADDALAKELQDVDAVALFYEPALRANNTTAWAALDAGKKLYTNRDEHSPTVAPTWESVIGALQESPVRA